ncbi:MAG: aminotransferase class III-fold pyridoxal phosphate-dependent enzyme, partial [Treponema sp.]|nr:aminotransferase class III-fold pyridoxal phosphate-dependent enzyme [Treponema sp.]
GVKPDIVTLAKGLAGGIPAGAVLAGAKAAEVFETGDHGSTFGGNPLACAAGLAVLDIVDNRNFLLEIKQKGGRLADGLRSIKQIKEVRSRGLMAAADIEGEAYPVLEAALEAGLLVLSAGNNTLRFLPPYVISGDEIDRGLAILTDALREQNAQRE